MFRKVPGLIIAMQVHAMVLFAQTNPVSVDHVTGTANVVLPLFTVKNGGITIPVSMIYSGGGVKPKDIEGTGGMNWNLEAGGTIEREVRGLPDDSKKDLSGNDRLGWIYNDNGTKINNFSITNDNNVATCNDEIADWNYLSANIPSLSDTEPDIFSVKAPGLSCRLVFDNGHVLRTIPYQDIRVSYAANPDGSIQSFTIINDKGIEYHFNYPDVVKRSASSDDPLAISFFLSNFSFYQNTIKYNNNWKLSTVKDPANNIVYFDYLNIIGQGGHSHINSNDFVYVTKANSERHLEYVVNQTFESFQLATIFYSTNEGSLTWKINYFEADSALGYPPKPVIKSIECPDHSIIFEHHVRTNSRRHFLTGIKTMACSHAAPTYQFDYQGRDRYNIIPLADSSSTEIDVWGYYNGSGAASLIPRTYINPSDPSLERYRSISPGNNTSYSVQINGVDRNANAEAAMIGALNKIIYENGGYTMLTYESNDFYDPVANAVVQGGGIRIKEIRDYDNLNASNSITRSFSYINPSTGSSSGKPIVLPQLAFTMPYGSATGISSTVRLEENLYSGDHSILYTHVKESLAGGGSTLYEFAVPATFFDGPLSDWSPTTVYHSRISCSSAATITNGKNVYPFPPDPNFEFERGLLNKIIQYNDNGQKLTETNYTYQRTGIPVVVTGLRSEVNMSVVVYAKYNVLTSVGKLKTHESVKDYDLITGQELIRSVNYYYDGAGHKLLTGTAVTDAEGITEKSFIQYTKDYAVPLSGGDTNASAIRKLQEQNVNIPVEKYWQRGKGGQYLTVGAELLRFKEFNPVSDQPFYRPSELLIFSSPGGVLDFVRSAYLSGTITNDQRYKVKQKFLAYDSKGFIQTSEDNRRIVKSILTDSKVQEIVAEIKGAAVNEFIINDFDSGMQPARRFAKVNGIYNYVPGRSGNNAITLQPSDILSASVDKNPRTTAYMFSVWVKATSAGVMQFTVVNAGQQYSISYGGNSDWKYYELAIPLSSSLSVLNIELKSSQPLSVDDILFYPQTAEITTRTYSPVSFLKTSETTAGGISEYYSYDTDGRLRYIHNQDRQIILKKSYVDKNLFDDADNLSISASYHSDLHTNEPATFSVDLTCNTAFEGLTFTWNFGDGSPVVTEQSGVTPLHVYTTAGTYLVSVTVTSPLWGTKILTYEVNVKPRKIAVTIQSNVSSGYISSIIFYKNGQVVGSMPSALNQPFLIEQGIYDMKVNYKGHSSFKSIKVNNLLFTDCFPIGSTSGSIMTFLDAASVNQVTITADNQACQLLLKQSSEGK